VYIYIDIYIWLPVSGSIRMYFYISTCLHICADCTGSACLPVTMGEDRGSQLLLMSEVHMYIHVHIHFCISMCTSGLSWQCVSCQFVGYDTGSHSLLKSEVHVDMNMCTCVRIHIYIYKYR